MCKNQLSPPMASSKPRIIKQLNPHAPVYNSVSGWPPETVFPHQMITCPQQPPVTQPLLTGSPPLLPPTQPGYFLYKQPMLVPYQFYTQYPPNNFWTHHHPVYYPSQFSHPVYYDIQNQPSAVEGNNLLCSAASVRTDESQPLQSVASPALIEEKENTQTYENESDKRQGKCDLTLKNSSVGPRLIKPRIKAKKLNSFQYHSSGRVQIWAPTRNGGTDGFKSKSFGKESSTSGASVPASSSPGSSYEAARLCIELEGKTSVMIRNIPNQFERDDLFKMLDNLCFEKNKNAKLGSDPVEYDFFYLPIDFKRHANLGYAFANFTTCAGALSFAQTFDGYEWTVRVPLRKRKCVISPARFQGKDALRNHFRNSKFPCNRLDYLPVQFSPPRNGSNDSSPIIIGRLAGAIPGSGK